MFSISTFSLRTIRPRDLRKEGGKRGKEGKEETRSPAALSLSRPTFGSLHVQTKKRGGGKKGNRLFFLS